MTKMAIETKIAMRTELSNLLVGYIKSRVVNPEFLVSLGTTRDDKNINNMQIWGDYNAQLSSNRITLINNALYDLNQELNKETPVFDTLKNIITAAMQENTTLSTQYGKQHFSYTQAINAGYNFFSALFKRTFCQSQANNTLEKCLETVGYMENQFSETTSLIG